MPKEKERESGRVRVYVCVRARVCGFVGAVREIAREKTSEKVLRKRKGKRRKLKGWKNLFFLRIESRSRDAVAFLMPSIYMYYIRNLSLLDRSWKMEISGSFEKLF